MKYRQGLVAALCVVLPTVVNADELLMKNGSRLVGTLVSSDESKVVFNTPFAGDITIEQANIETLITEEPVTLLMNDGTIYRDKQVVSHEDSLLVYKENQEPIQFNVLDIKLMNPEPWRLGDGYKWFGKIDAAMQAERGNTDTDELDLFMESIWRSLEDRFTIRGSMEVDESNGEKNKNTWKMRNKYDRFSKSDPDNYYGYQLFFEHDEFADLDLRIMTGPYIGRQFFESDFLSLQGEVGIVYVDEQFDVAEDSDFWGSSWELRLTSGIIPQTELYVNQSGVLNLNETGDSIVNTTVGISFPIILGFTAGAEAKYEYDGGAVEGVDTTDKTFNFKLGYAW